VTAYTSVGSVSSGKGRYGGKAYPAVKTHHSYEKQAMSIEEVHDMGMLSRLTASKRKFEAIVKGG
jgi:hypothetical protein